MLRLEDDEVCALYELDADRREAGVSSHWLSYVSVEGAGTTAKRAKKLGGSVLMEPFDAADFGRMVIVADPMGATFAAWEPHSLAGASRVNDPGCLGWNELQTRDPETATDFYSRLFDWTVEPIEQDGEMVYATIKNSAGRTNGGVMPMTEDYGDSSSYWLPYFIVNSCDESVARIKELGGKVLAGPMEPGAGRIAVARDPQGAVFAIFEGETDG